MRISSLPCFVPLRAAVLLLAGAVCLSGHAQDVPAGDAHTMITVIPKNNHEAQPSVTNANVTAKVDGKQANITHVSHFGSNQANLELVLLVDDSARSSLGLYLKEMATFLTSLPPSTAVSVAYIENGAPRFTQPFTLDHASAAKTLHLPGSPAGANSDPYFALTSLVDHWPSQNQGMRHEVVMVSDGVDPYYGLRYDPENPYVSKATAEAQKHGVVVYSIYYKDRGRADRFGVAINSGQNYLIQMSEATGGELYYEGFENPVSFQPFLEQISRNLQNQYEVSMGVPPKVKDGLQTLKLKVNTPDTKTNSADHIFVGDPMEEKK